MGSSAIVAVEENDRVVMLKVPEKVGSFSESRCARLAVADWQTNHGSK
jgi:hypothetical protein